jgi:hypothetical protein
MAEGNGKYILKDRCRFFDIPTVRRWNAPPVWTFSSPKRN